MKKLFLLCVVVCIIFSFCGCDNGKSNESIYSNNVVPNMVTVAKGETGYDYFYVLDKRTGIVYIQFSGFRRAGITVAYNEDGSVMTVDDLNRYGLDVN